MMDRMMMPMGAQVSRAAPQAQRAVAARPGRSARPARRVQALRRRAGGAALPQPHGSGGGRLTPRGPVAPD